MFREKVINRIVICLLLLGPMSVIIFLGIMTFCIIDMSLLKFNFLRHEAINVNPYLFGLIVIFAFTLIVQDFSMIQEWMKVHMRYHYLMKQNPHRKFFDGLSLENFNKMHKIA